MRLETWAWILFLIAYCLLCGCNNTELPSEVVYDVGPVILDLQREDSWRVEHTFLIKNSTRQTVTLDVPLVSCGCAKCDLSTTTLDPGDDLKVSMAYSLRYLREKRAESARIGWIDETGKTGVIHILLTSDVFPAIVTDLPSGSLDFDLGRPLPSEVVFDFYAYCLDEDDEFLNIETSMGKWELPGSIVDVSPQVQKIGKRIKRLEKTVRISPQVLEKYPQLESLNIIAKGPKGHYALPLNIRRATNIQLDRQTIFLSPQVKTAIIEITTDSTDVAESIQIDFDKELFEIELNPTQNPNVMVVQVALKGAQFKETLERTIRFSSGELGPVDCQAYVLKNTN